MGGLPTSSLQLCQSIAPMLTLAMHKPTSACIILSPVAPRRQPLKSPAMISAMVLHSPLDAAWTTLALPNLFFPLIRQPPVHRRLLPQTPIYFPLQCATQAQRRVCMSRMWKLHKNLCRGIVVGRLRDRVLLALLLRRANGPRLKKRRDVMSRLEMV